MIKKIPIAELRIGMYLHDMDCVWRIERAFKARFKIRNDGQLEQLKQLGAREVYIDTQLGLDLVGAPTEAQVQQALEETMQAIGRHHSDQEPLQLATREQQKQAAKTHQEACLVLQQLMQEVRIGDLTVLDRVEEALLRISDSIFSEIEPLLQLEDIDQKDHYTFQHSVDVCALLTGFSRALGLGREITRQIQLGGLLHDLGKTRIPLEILNKPGGLSDEEFSLIKTHVAAGGEILQDIPWMTPIARQVVLHHHERFDGTGYPFRLKGNHISLYGQMAAIVDVYDAITADRSYHKALTPAASLRKIQEWSSHQFNHELVSHFVRSLGIYPIKTLVRLESGRLGLVIAQNARDQTRPMVRVVFDTRKQASITPYELDLEQARYDRILGCENPETFHIELARYMEPLGAAA